MTPLIHTGSARLRVNLLTRLESVQLISHRTGVLHLFLTPALIAHIKISSQPDIFAPIFGAQSDMHDHQGPYKWAHCTCYLWFCSCFCFIRRLSHISSLVFALVGRFKSNIVDRCNYLVPNTNWMVEMPLTLVNTIRRSHHSGSHSWWTTFHYRGYFWQKVLRSPATPRRIGFPKFFLHVNFYAHINFLRVHNFSR